MVTKCPNVIIVYALEEPQDIIREETDYSTTH